ncbi:MAG: 50S ribosomal protein L24 [Candidatus Zambryskibacteria bacterium]|nr:50S ribosomal protein L24 [Candidatus Zambryskibacteria bacterium]
MHVKKGDNVIVLAGKDKGKTGKISRALPRTNQVLVEGVNSRKMTQKSKKGGGKGEVIEKHFPIHASNVRLTDNKQPTTNKKTKKVVGSKS